MSRVCSVSSYNFADTARRLRESLASQDDLEAGIYGTFFDPLVNFDKRHLHPNMEGMTEEERKAAWEKYSEEVRKVGMVAGKARLKKQIDHFLSELKKKEVIESPAP